MISSDGALHGCLSGCVSSRQSQPAKIEMPINPAQIKFGRRKGNFPKIPSDEKVPGKLDTGVAKYPPIAGPQIVPTDQTKGMTAYALAGAH